MANWGTKWNADNTEILDGNSIEFTTAWSAPIPVIVALSKKYPDVRFAHIWADEDMGCNTGSLVYLNGEIIEECIPEAMSHEAYELYIKCHGETPSLRLNEAGEYIYDENY